MIHLLPAHGLAAPGHGTHILHSLASADHIIWRSREATKESSPGCQPWVNGLPLISKPRRGERAHVCVAPTGLWYLVAPGTQD